MKNICVCECLLSHNNHRTKQNNNKYIIILIAGVPSSQALPGFLITAPPSVCVSAILVSLAVWIQNQKKNKERRNVNRGGVMDLRFWNCGMDVSNGAPRRFRSSALLHLHRVRSWCTRRATCVDLINNKNQNKISLTVIPGQVYDSCHESGFLFFSGQTMFRPYYI